MSYHSFNPEDSVGADEHYMRAAIAEAQRAATANEIPIGAVVVCKNKIIGRGHNLTERLNDVTAHAEMQAFTAASQTIGGKYLKDCTLYVTIEPCVMCAGASYWMQVSRIVYGAREPKRGFLSKNTPLLHPKTKLEGGVLEKECAELMQVFFTEKRRSKLTNP